MTPNSERPTETPQHGPDAADLAASVIGRMNRRSAILGWISMILWLLVAGGVVAYTWFFVTYVNPILVAAAHYKHFSPDLSKHEETVRHFFRVLPTVTDITAISSCVWAGLVVLSAAWTLLYVRASRRATLHQIHAGLAEISEQLKALSAPQAIE